MNEQRESAIEREKKAKRQRRRDDKRSSFILLIRDRLMKSKRKKREMKKEEKQNIASPHLSLLLAQTLLVRSTDVLVLRANGLCVRCVRALHVACLLIKIKTFFVCFCSLRSFSHFFKYTPDTRTIHETEIAIFQKVVQVIFSGFCSCKLIF